MSRVVMGGEEDESVGPLGSGGGRKTFWRSASWSASRTSAVRDHVRDCGAEEKGSGNGQFRRCPAPPLTPRSQSHKARSCLPPLQPLAIARRSLDEWPKAGSDDVGEWPQPPTPGAKSETVKPGEGLKLDLSSLRSQGKRDQIAFYDKECSKVAEHIYLGGDYVARNKEILRQHGITHVLNCVGFVCPEYFKSDFIYKTLWLQDSPTEDITSILYDVFDYFEDVRQQDGRVFVHCCQGVSRSTSLVIAYLMWREGQSFDDAFHFVKAARGIANPNMGFACQLLQCQKRVHAIPMSPNSVLRMYRMAPHSSYDPLHLVPKMLNDPLPTALDSRGAFIIHVLSSIYVWVGKNCEPVMEKDAKAAAFQVVRYERVQGPILIVKEGEEPLDFWEAFSSAPLSENGTKIDKEQIEMAAKIVYGNRRVSAYDIDFELFYKAITGGVVPPFSSPGHGQETHVPARESNWSVLRRKFTSNALYRVHSDSELAARSINYKLLTVETSISPPYPSPDSLSSDSSSTSKSSSESPSISPSTSSSPSLTPPPVSSNLPDLFMPLSRSSLEIPRTMPHLKPSLEVFRPPGKGLARSLAERRGSFSAVKLPSLGKSSSLSDKPVNSRSDKSNGNVSCDDNVMLQQVSLDVVSDVKYSSEPTICVSENFVKLHDSHLELDRLCLPNSTKVIRSGLTCPSLPLVYRWPDMQRLSKFGAEEINSKEVLFFLAHDSNRNDTEKILHLWVGSDFEHANNQSHSSRNKDGSTKSVDWHQVGCNFLDFLGLPENLPIKVFQEQDKEKLLEVLNCKETNWKRLKHTAGGCQSDNYKPVPSFGWPDVL